MPLDPRSRTGWFVAAPLDLPPPFRLVTLREAGDTFAHARSIAADEGAGTLVHVGRFDLVEFAVVLEPEEPLRIARRALYAGMCALGDALAVHAPPEKPINFDWPDAIRIDGGLVGGGRLAWPPETDEAQPPPWLVFGAMIRTVAMGEGEPGLRPIGSALEEEGFDDVGSGRLVETFARHLMVTIDAWQERGFTALAKDYLTRLALPPSPSPASGGEKGGRWPLNIDENGDLLEGRQLDEAPRERRSLIRAISEPSWLDAVTGQPRV